jgi:NAD dependent epimerase/dehydratase family enzyme
LLGREAADEVVSASQRVEPVVLSRAGYRFAHPTVAEAVQAELT